MAMVNGKRVKSIIMHQIKNEMITKLMQEVRGSEVKFNINTETITASARMSLERNKQGVDVSTLHCKCCLSPTST